jgi:arylsulfatase A-like enzyme
MSKRSTLMLTVLFLSFSWHAHADGGEASERPNILFVIVDSHRSDALGINGHPIVKTPHIDALAKEGLNFKQAYVTTAICAVSRASILSGQYQQRHTINDFSSDFSDTAWEEVYPMQLKKAGYKVAQIGFLGVGKNPRSDSFDHWDARIPWMSEDGEHQTDGITRRAVRFIEQQGKDEKPFYLAVSYTAAHEIDPKGGVPAHYQVQSRFKDWYQEVEIPVPLSASEEQWQTFPDFFKTDQNIGRARWKGFFSDDSLLKENTRNYYRLISGLDEAVGSMIRAVRTHAPHTVVVYVSDHGFSLGEHGLMGKWYGFKEGIHVPLIVSDLRENRRLPVGVSEEFALNIDLAPTLLGIAGIPPSQGMQGIDLLQTLGKKEGRRSSFFYEHTVFQSPLLPKVEGVVGKDYKYMRFTEHDYEQFYDLRTDKHELINQAQNPSYQSQLQKYRNLYAQYRKELP